MRLHAAPELGFHGHPSDFHGDSMHPRWQRGARPQMPRACAAMLRRACFVGACFVEACLLHAWALSGGLSQVGFLRWAFSRG